MFQKRGRRGVPTGPYSSLVAAQLRHLDKTVFRFIEFGMIRLAEERHAHQRAVGAIAPAVIRAGKYSCVPVIVAANLHAAMPARIEKHMHGTTPVTAEDHRLLAHARGKEIPRVGDLALMPHKQPRPREHPFLLLGVNLVIDEDLTADQPRCEIDETGMIPARCVYRHRNASIVTATAQTSQAAL